MRGGGGDQDPRDVKRLKGSSCGSKNSESSSSYCRTHEEEGIWSKRMGPIGMSSILLAEENLDGGSCENVISTYMVEKLGIKTEDHPEPYQLTWLKKGTLLKSVNVVLCSFLLEEKNMRVPKQFNKLLRSDGVTYFVPLILVRQNLRPITNVDGRPDNANWAMVSCYFVQILLQNSTPLFYANGDKYATPWSDVDQDYELEKCRELMKSISDTQLKVLKKISFIAKLVSSVFLFQSGYVL
ncbi:hypothetical protein Tco_0772194 [Tanacetum coccineum]|uniref:Uncharacterized protein n=1 Tax=Tanacetum coccineum TaxID=301880 RepID=A0ABQ4ZL66_9ASTR